MNTLDPLSKWDREDEKETPETALEKYVFSVLNDPRFLSWHLFFLHGIELHIHYVVVNRGRPRFRAQDLVAVTVVLGHQ
jgi:hypothetical protein